MSTQKLELSVAGASNPSARVKKLIAPKLRADNIFYKTCFRCMHGLVMAKHPNFRQISLNKMCLVKSLCQSRVTPCFGAPILNCHGTPYVCMACAI